MQWTVSIPPPSVRLCRPPHGVASNDARIPLLDESLLNRPTIFLDVFSGDFRQRHRISFVSHPIHPSIRLLSSHPLSFPCLLPALHSTARDRRALCSPFLLRPTIDRCRTRAATPLRCFVFPAGWQRPDLMWNGVVLFKRSRRFLDPSPTAAVSHPATCCVCNSWSVVNC